MYVARKVKRVLHVSPRSSRRPHNSSTVRKSGNREAEFVGKIKKDSPTAEEEENIRNGTFHVQWGGKGLGGKNNAEGNCMNRMLRSESSKRGYSYKFPAKNGALKMQQE